MSSLRASSTSNRQLFIKLRPNNLLVVSHCRNISTKCSKRKVGRNSSKKRKNVKVQDAVVLYYRSNRESTMDSIVRKLEMRFMMMSLVEMHIPLLFVCLCMKVELGWTTLWLLNQWFLYTMSQNSLVF